jgi:hypothetical protein
MEQVHEIGELSVSFGAKRSRSFAVAAIVRSRSDPQACPTAG